jgi:hypothetical protein
MPLSSIYRNQIWRIITRQKAEFGFEEVARQINALDNDKNETLSLQ